MIQSRVRLKIDAAMCASFTLESLRSQISVVLQDNVALCRHGQRKHRLRLPGASLAEIVAAARLLTLHEFISARLRATKTILGERGVTLSQGQRQRIAIARAAFAGAPILILDEPTTGLDRKMRPPSASLDSAPGERTTFLITHDLSQRSMLM